MMYTGTRRHLFEYEPGLNTRLFYNEASLKSSLQKLCALFLSFVNRSLLFRDAGSVTYESDRCSIV